MSLLSIHPRRPRYVPPPHHGFHLLRDPRLHRNLFGFTISRFLQHFSHESPGVIHIIPSQCAHPRSRGRRRCALLWWNPDREISKGRWLRVKGPPFFIEDAFIPVYLSCCHICPSAIGECPSLVVSHVAPIVGTCRATSTTVLVQRIERRHRLLLLEIGNRLLLLDCM